MGEVPKGQERSIKKTLFMQVQNRISPTRFHIQMREVPKGQQMSAKKTLFINVHLHVQ
jgi:hypothetical protein